MAATDLEAAWRTLVAEGPERPGWHVRRLAGYQGPCQLLAAVDFPACSPALLVELSSASVAPSTRYPESAGFEVFPEMISPRSRGRVRICLRLTRPAFRGVFSILCSDVVERVSAAASETAALVAMIERLHAWQAFMQRRAAGVLSHEAIVGLYAELVVLRDIVLKALDPRTAVSCWQGPLAGLHDFSAPSCSLEVKGTTISPPTEIPISTLGQLDDEPVGTLVLSHVLLGHGDGAISLADLVSSLCGSLQSISPAAASLFEDRLLAAGYHPVEGGSPGNEAFTVLHCRHFLVQGAFPRLRGSTLPAGIAHGHYSIQFGACVPFEIERTRVLELLTTGGMP